MFFRMVYKSGQIFLPFCHNPRVWRADRRTDRILIARPRLHCMQRGKNEVHAEPHGPWAHRAVMISFSVTLSTSLHCEATDSGLSTFIIHHVQW